MTRRIDEGASQQGWHKLAATVVVVGVLGCVYDALRPLAEASLHKVVFMGLDSGPGSWRRRLEVRPWLP